MYNSEDNWRRKANWVIQPSSVVSSEVLGVGWDVMTRNLYNEGVGVSKEVSEEAVVILAQRNM